MSLLNNKFLKNLILIIIFLYTSIGYAKTPYIEGKNLKNLLSSNEITIKTEEGLTHAYQFNSDMTYEVFSYPKRNLIGKGRWEMYPGYQVDVSYRLPDHIYLKGYKSELRDPYFIFVSDPKIIIIPQNLMNPNAYDVVEIISVLSKTKVKQIINERIAKERAEEEKLAKIKAEQERINQEKLAKKRAEEEKLAKIKAEQERIQAEKERERRNSIQSTLIGHDEQHWKVSKCQIRDGDKDQQEEPFQILTITEPIEGKHRHRKEQALYRDLHDF